MAERKAFLIRLPAGLLEDLNRWAGDELRSLNAQIEYVLREAVRKRTGRKDDAPPDPDETPPGPPQQ